MPKAAKMHEPAAKVRAEPVVARNPNRQKQSAFLVTSDDSLWVQIGGIGNDWFVKQLDTIDDLVAATQSGQTGVVLWDARGCPNQADVLSRIQLHSDRFAIVALDVSADVGAWTAPLEQRQVVATLSLPIDQPKLVEALARGLEEIHARVALLGEASATVRLRPKPSLERYASPKPKHSTRQAAPSLTRWTFSSSGPNKPCWIDIISIRRKAVR